MAKALIIDDPFGQGAQIYYNSFPDEPCSQGLTILVESPTLVKDMSLDRLLQAIIDAWRAKDFQGNDLVLVTHGNARGLTMRLFPGHVTDSRSDVLEIIAGSESDESKAAKCKCTKEEMQALVTKMQAVQKLGLGSVEFRGCRIGLTPKNLTVLKTLLGASSVSGPDLLSTFGFARPQYRDAKHQLAFDRLFTSLQGKSNVWIHIGRVLFNTVPIPDQHADRITMLAEKPDLLLEWLQTFMYSGTTATTAKKFEKNLPVHYLSSVPPIMPLDGNNRFTVPGAEAYVSHIIRTP